MTGSNPNRPSSQSADPYEEPEEAPADAFDLESLRARGDTESILALAKAYRSGSAPGGRDLGKCLDAYRAAAVLGSGEGEYAVALFVMNGSAVVAQDLKEGTMRLRSAAEKGSIPAKIYLGNLYELGIHYKADPEKADVWYRNAARTARIEAEPGTAEWNRALADLGGARYVLAFTNDASTTEDEKSRLLARAKAHGFGLRVRDGTEGDRATFTEAMNAAEAPSTLRLHDQPVIGAPRVDPAAAQAFVRDRKDTSPETKQAKEKKSIPPPDPLAKAKAEVDNAAADAKKKKAATARNARLASALGAFGYAILFALAGLGAGYAALLGARELVAHGHLLPLLGTRTQVVFPIVLALVGVLPTCLVYRLGTVIKALLMSAALAGVGWIAWGTGRGAYHSDRPMQALAFAIGGFLAGLLVLGLLGGAKTPRRSR